MDAEPKKRGRPPIIRPPSEPKTLGRPRLVGKPPLSARDARATEMARAGLTPADIAVAMKLTQVAVACLLSRARRNGIADIPKMKRGPKGSIGWRDVVAS